MERKNLKEHKRSFEEMLKMGFVQKKDFFYYQIKNTNFFILIFDDLSNRENLIQIGCRKTFQQIKFFVIKGVNCLLFVGYVVILLI